MQKCRNAILCCSYLYISFDSSTHLVCSAYAGFLLTCCLLSGLRSSSSTPCAPLFILQVCVRVCVCVLMRVCMCVCVLLARACGHACTRIPLGLTLFNSSPDTLLGGMPPPASLSLVALLSSLQAPATVSWSSLQSTPLTAALQAPVPPSLLSPLPPTAGLALSPAAQLFPQRIVDHIRLGAFVEMCDLLMDNITLIDQLEGLPGPPVAVPGMPRPRLREVSSLPTWI